MRGIESSSGRPGCARKSMTHAADHRAPEGNVTNEEILAKWRQRRGRITLSTAMELERLEKSFAHLAKAK